MKIGVSYYTSAALYLTVCCRVVLADDHLPDLIKRVQRSVVTVFAVGTDYETQGSGFFAKPGLVVTKAHVIRAGTRYFVQTCDGNIFAVKSVAANDSERDLAVLRVDGANTPLTLSAETPQVGQRVFVIGTPLGLEQTVTDGIVSAIRDPRGASALLQISAAISHGSSGSPVIDANRAVIGVATFKLSHGDSLNFAVPAATVAVLL